MKYAPNPVPLETDQVLSYLEAELRRIQSTLVNTDSNLIWDDLKAPSFTLRAGSAAPSINTTFGWYEFAQNQDQYAFLQVQLPHDYAIGTDLRPHVHWMKTTSATGEVEWQLDYRWARIGETMDGAWTTLSDLTPDISDQDTQYHHAITGLGTISGTLASISDMLICKITRLGSSYSGSNHYTAAAALLEFDLHYQRDIGSVEEFTKLKI